jgi:hypothetical protein
VFHRANAKLFHQKKGGVNSNSWFPIQTLNIQHKIVVIKGNTTATIDLMNPGNTPTKAIQANKNGGMNVNHKKKYVSTYKHTQKGKKESNIFPL